jgi:hypothetical protein
MIQFVKFYNMPWNARVDSVRYASVKQVLAQRVGPKEHVFRLKASITYLLI